MNSDAQISPMYQRVNMRYSGIAMCTVVVVFGLGWFFAYLLQVKPVRDRQDAILRALKSTASDVNTYRKLHGPLPLVRTGTLIPHEEYRLVPINDEASFLIVANRVFIDELGRRYQFACDEQLKVREIPTSFDAEKPNKPLIHEKDSS